MNFTFPMFRLFSSCAMFAIFLFAGCAAPDTPQSEQVKNTVKQEKVSKPTKEVSYTFVRSKKPKKGHVYVVRNKAYGRNVYKVGITTQKDPQKRIKSLQGSGVPYPFRVVYLVKSDDVVALERATHSALAPYRMAENREFFRVNKDVIIKTLTAIEKSIKNDKE